MKKNLSIQIGVQIRLSSIFKNNFKGSPRRMVPVDIYSNHNVRKIQGNNKVSQRSVSPNQVRLRQQQKTN